MVLNRHQANVLFFEVNVRVLPVEQRARNDGTDNAKADYKNESFQWPFKAT